eukprot:10259980-Ditylum_brightwellii.AAC.1
MEAPLNCTIVLAGTIHLTGVIPQEHLFNLQEHNAAMDGGQRDGKSRKQKYHEHTFSAVMATLTSNFK